MLREPPIRRALPRRRIGLCRAFSLFQERIRWIGGLRQRPRCKKIKKMWRLPKLMGQVQPADVMAQFSGWGEPVWVARSLLGLWFVGHRARSGPGRVVGTWRQ